MLSVELFRRAKLRGYSGGKSALYALVKGCASNEFGRWSGSRASPASSRSTTRATSTCGTSTGGSAVHFFASRLKHSRWVEVSLVESEQVEALVRAMVEHFAAWGGLSLLAVFDPPKTVALSWTKELPRVEALLALRAR